MKLIDRYIYEVGRHLPRKERADIQAELRSLLLDALEASGGEEANEEQVVAMLKEFGSPQKVAASYRPENQYLIGPELYPLFRFVLPIVLAVLVGVNLLLLALAGLAHVQVNPLESLANLFGGLVNAFGMTVLTFAILQRFLVRPMIEEEDWDPRQLPEVEDEDQLKRGELVAGTVFAAILLGLLWAFRDKIGFVITPGTEIITNPVIIRYIPLISVSLLLGIGLNLFVLRRGRWDLLTRLVKVGLDVFGIYVLYTLVVGHAAWLAERGVGGFFAAIELLSAGGMADTASAQVIGMQFFQFALAIALIVVTITVAIEIFGLVRRMVTPGKSYLAFETPKHEE